MLPHLLRRNHLLMQRPLPASDSFCHASSPCVMHLHRVCKPGSEWKAAQMLTPVVLVADAKDTKCIT